MFIWTAIAHMALPLGEAGIGEVPNDEALMTAMQSSIGAKTGLYIFPGMGLGPDATHAQRSEAMKGYEAKLEKNPSGLLLYHPAGSRPMVMSKYLTIEFATEVLEALLAVFLLAQTRIGSFGGRLGFVTVTGIFPIGIGGVFPRSTPRRTCLSSSSASSSSASWPRSSYRKTSPETVGQGSGPGNQDRGGG